jgi:hypothetical protein
MKIFTGLILFLLATCLPAAANTWLGTIDNSWHIGGNWSDGTVPDASTDVTIVPAANEPIIFSGPAECRSMGTASGSFLEIGASLTVHGDLNVNGEIYIPYIERVEVFGDVDWRAGSSASIGSWTTFHVHGDWLFHSGANVQMTNGVVDFVGDTTSIIYSHEENCHFYTLRISKTDGAQVAIYEGSSQDLHIFNDLQVRADADLYSSASIAIVVNGDFINFINGHFDFDNGTVVTTGALPNIVCNDGRFYNLTIQSSGTTGLGSDLKMDGSLVIETGGLNAHGYDIEIKGDWTNNCGIGTFVGDYGQVTFRGSNSTITASGYESFYDLAVSGYVSPPISATLTISADNTVFVENDLNVFYLGTTNVAQGAKLKAENQINVNFGAMLSAIGASDNYAYVGGPGENYDRPSISIGSNGKIAAEYTVFEYLDAGGIDIKNGARVSDLHSFTNCKFRWGATGGTMMTVDNSQVLTFHDVEFLENTLGCKYNISKNADQGQVRFTSFHGPFSGPRYENDPHHRILWGDGPHDIGKISPVLQLLLLTD